MQTPTWFYKKSHPVALLLWPVSQLYRLTVLGRRMAYSIGLKKIHRLPVPVIVVGNITVGGTGKTPLVIWLAEQCKSLGYKPGIILRGYKGESQEWPQLVTPESDPALVGDEAVVIARRTNCPVCADPDRPNAARTLIENGDVDLIISDDGLQHYALARDIEIMVIDGARRYGNGMLLPAGPLREHRKRASHADLVVTNGTVGVGEYGLRQKATTTVNLVTGERRPLSFWRYVLVHAVAGLGNPQRYFRILEEAGVEVTRHPFEDHHDYTSSDLDFSDENPIMMTEKDAVKCVDFADDSYWYLELDIDLDNNFADAVTRALRFTNKGPVNG
ncbi:tetraacyldisaccharide 4'-kinase [Solemya velum gill symbiont]|uniref:Tetraacyldisaccharide 4'-kinase n=1 Tax=Solemya velum gill symbiont TaxID=2340 RepID=A0A1T2IJD8_SOVGS|nr:tetraacyldisaccharide 4'-kinase [Solemya velum gill symbiont]OOY34014.1 tetraacyldisaccharide 4'-kinase [Solemya velum gill symbiont]OOY36663.1 tetraacyldisaccharide 4'-kinase [Solemya velum gill symbiont]OOY39493.1 tetraacyldisaccharide 4'-kinase [Solemya velum gill symbiont]OOY44007.1 tetraacyldisaccharide 4'-kinase [Solemya velum gill symbiont]OOY45008.1 tetraacyldisaccharide 4'-kinase [Solemya velum gill symbiont]